MRMMNFSLHAIKNLLFHRDLKKFRISEEMREIPERRQQQRESDHSPERSRFEFGALLRKQKITRDNDKRHEPMNALGQDAEADTEASRIGEGGMSLALLE